MMKIKNTGTLRIRLDKTLYILPGEELSVSKEIGAWAIHAHKDIISLEPAPYVPKYKSRPIVTKVEIDNE